MLDTGSVNYLKLPVKHVRVLTDVTVEVASGAYSRGPLDADFANGSFAINGGGEGRVTFKASTPRLKKSAAPVLRLGGATGNVGAVVVVEGA